MCFAIGRSRGTAELERALALASTTSTYSLKSGRCDDLLDDDELPSVTEIFQSQAACSWPKLIDLTLELSDDVNT
jgi:hypothetical protein